MHLRIFLGAFLHADLSRVNVYGGWFARTLTRLAGGAEGIAFGQNIFFSGAAFAEYQKRSVEGVLLTVHEATHTVQYATEGVSTFLRNYACDYIANRRAGMRRHEAYRNIGAEVQACTNQEVLRTFLSRNLDILEAIQQGVLLTDEQLGAVAAAPTR